MPNPENSSDRIKDSWNEYNKRMLRYAAYGTGFTYLGLFYCVMVHEHDKKPLLYFGILMVPCRGCLAECIMLLVAGRNPVISPAYQKLAT